MHCDEDHRKISYDFDGDPRRSVKYRKQSTQSRSSEDHYSIKRLKFYFSKSAGGLSDGPYGACLKARGFDKKRMAPLRFSFSNSTLVIPVSCGPLLAEFQLAQSLLCFLSVNPCHKSISIHDELNSTQEFATGRLLTSHEN